MNHQRPAVIGICAALLLCGCGSNKTVDMAAASAAQQLGELQLSLTARVNEHNKYLDGAEDRINEELDRYRSDDIDLFFLTNKVSYMSGLRGATPETVSVSLVGFAQSTLTAWQSRDARREEKRVELLAALDEAKQEVALEMGKMRKLRSQLSLIATPRQGKDAFLMLAAYLKEVDKELEKLKDEGNEDET
jgi:hypothetical protein